MALTLQDLVKGVDFTGLLEATDADLNNLAELAYPVEDTNGDGKGLVLISNDTALDTPVVPDASATLKWKRYLWVRKPYNTAEDTTPFIYGWDENADSDPTLLKWVRLHPDVDSFNAAIAALQAEVDAVETVANAASVNATAANTLATDANNNATNALTQIETITDTANSAVTIANEAAADIVSLEAQLAATNTAVAAKKAVNDAINPGLALQLIRTKSDASGVEWFNLKDLYIKLSENQAKNTDAGAAVTGENIRQLNTSVYGANILTIPGDGTFTLPAGTYYGSIQVPGFADDNAHQAYLMKDADDSILLTGTSCKLSAAGNTTGLSIITGIFTLAADTKCKVSDYFVGNEADHGLGKAANVAPSGGEVYTTAEFWRIG